MYFLFQNLGFCYTLCYAAVVTKVNYYLWLLALIKNIWILEIMIKGIYFVSLFYKDTIFLYFLYLDHSTYIIL